MSRYPITDDVVWCSDCHDYHLPNQHVRAASQASTGVDEQPDPSLLATDAPCGCLVNVPVSGTFTTACEQGAPCGSRPSPPDSPAHRGLTPQERADIDAADDDD